MIPTISSGKRVVLLTWDNTDIDLDLTIFTPYQSSNGNMAHIGSDVLNDSDGLVAEYTAPLSSIGIMV